jgi:transcriptional regulator with XRE-family HTH domain/mannose-6-phosphate isomerase-like protein (cupin superfamily)
MFSDDFTLVSVRAVTCHGGEPGRVARCVAPAGARGRAVRSYDAAVSSEPSLGARLRALRETRGVSARSLAATLGISASAMSQIERDVMRPSVVRLLAITDALGVSLSDVFEPPGAVAGPHGGAAGPLGGAAGPHTGIAVTRAWEATPMTLDGGVTFRRLSPDPVNGLDFFESIYPPGATATLGDTELFKHEGYEIGNVVAGELTVELPDDEVVLAAGDSISYPCSVPHRIRNAGVRPAVATWLIVHP